MKRKIFLQRHRITPKSRGGENGKNIKIVPSEFHTAYHKLFENMTPDEVSRYLHEVWFTYKHFVSPLDWLKSENK